MAHHDHNTAHGGAAHGSVKEYVTGLILSIVLTAIPFGVVMSGALGEAISLWLILLCAIGQVLVQEVRLGKELESLAVDIVRDRQNVTSDGAGMLFEIGIGNLNRPCHRGRYPVCKPAPKRIVDDEQRESRSDHRR